MQLYSVQSWETKHTPCFSSLQNHFQQKELEVILFCMTLCLSHRCEEHLAHSFLQHCFTSLRFEGIYLKVPLHFSWVKVWTFFFSRSVAALIGLSVYCSAASCCSSHLTLSHHKHTHKSCSCKTSQNDTGISVSTTVFDIRLRCLCR